MRQNGHHKYNQLREQFPYFRYVNYQYEQNEDDLVIRFVFDLSGKYTFTPTLKLVHRSFYNLRSLSANELNNLIFHIGMIELISYWKLACPPKLIIEPHQLSQEQVRFWKKLYLNGLGEFFYLNGITPDPDEFIEIQSHGTKTTAIKKPLSKGKVLVPVGGGKDSVVTLELLKNTSFRVYPMMLNPREASERTVEIAGFETAQSVVVERTLDPLMLDLNKQGFLNGHTPFSALLAFVNVLTATASGAKYVALSNENSANESTVPGTNINHQYSKSFEFEHDFMEYCRKYVHQDLSYFSFLRPLNELQIAGLFAKFPQHFDSFRSCNVGSKTDAWCGKCPKCLFTRIILAPFVPEEKLTEIFHGDLLEDASLTRIFEELTGVSPVKPFECVGTPDEVKTAIHAVYGKTGPEKLPALLKNHDFSANGKDDFETLINAFNFQHLLPARFLKVLLRHLSVPEEKWFGIFLKSKFGLQPKVMILGFGREGKASYKLLRKIYPDLMLYIADRNEAVRELEFLKKDQRVEFRLGTDYLSFNDDFTVVIKSPGVKLQQQATNWPLSSQTDLFLEFYTDQTIGVTGTKGKSTTVSLIYHLLEQSGKKALLLGNIGVPPFDLVEKIVQDTRVVFEMSAHQLEQVHHSPHIAVLLNLFPEHLDHFDSFEAYRKAKYNILKYQQSGDVAVIHHEFAGEVRGKCLLFGPKQHEALAAYADGNKLVFPELEESFEVAADRRNLMGRHNLLNILAALLAVEQCDTGLSDVFHHISSFKSLPHRMEYIGNYGGVDFYNDSISTVPESTLAAVHSLKLVETLILGGFDRGLDFTQMVYELNRSTTKHFIFLGKAGEKMRKIFEEIHSDKDLLTVKNMEEAVTYALKNTDSGICLLSPAAASYDQFHNFEHRGDTFKKELEKSRHKKSG